MPAYLPNGQIVFSSTRDLKYCQCNRHVCPNLFVMDADGRRLLQIGHNNLPELHARSCPTAASFTIAGNTWTGSSGPSYGLWTCNPDGTGHALYYGSNAWSPGGWSSTAGRSPAAGRSLRFRLLPRPPWGAWPSSIDAWAWRARPVARILAAKAIRTCSKGIDNFSMADVCRIEPFRAVWPKYEDPWPLADAAGRGAGKYFLVPELIGLRWAIRGWAFPVDVFGNELLRHDE